MRLAGNGGLGMDFSHFSTQFLFLQLQVEQLKGQLADSNLATDKCRTTTVDPTEVRFHKFFLRSCLILRNPNGGR